ncbi:class I mannose-6-phosphate isomerase [soil metagenome]
MKTVTSAAPLTLAPNYVWRTYRGGSELRAFRGETGTVDDHLPEDWLASTVRARNGAKSSGPDEGMSRVTWQGGMSRLADLTGEAEEYFPGKGKDGFGVLLKLLDSAERLHIQAHPNNSFVQTTFQGAAGKTECWYVISTRQADAWVYLGLQRPPAPGEWQRMIEEQDIAAMLACFDRIPVKPGDCLMVPAGVPHAIGEGIFLMELQQPSDWVVRCEFTVGDYTLPHEARFMGLELAQCMEIFDFTAYAPDAWRQKPHELARSAGHVEEDLIESAYSGFFRLRRLHGTREAEFICRNPAVLIVIAGAGTLRTPETTLNLRRGETVLLPSSSQPLQWSPVTEGWEILLAQPPTQ